MENNILWFLLAIVALFMLVLIGGLWLANRAQIRIAELEARARQDMLDRGLSVEEIARLLQLAPSKAPVPAPPAASPRERPSAVALGLATALESMVSAGVDTDGIAAFLDTFFRRGDEFPEMIKPPAQARHPTETVGKNTEIQRLDSARDG